MPVQLLQSVLGSVDPYDSCFILPFQLCAARNHRLERSNWWEREIGVASSDHDVVTAVLDDGHGRAIGAAEMSQVRENPHSFVREIDGRLHVAIAAGNPFLVDLSPVFRSQLAPGHVAELLLILCGEQTSSESSEKAWNRVAGEGEGGSQDTAYRLLGRLPGWTARGRRQQSWR